MGGKTGSTAEVLASLGGATIQDSSGIKTCPQQVPFHTMTPGPREARLQKPELVVPGRGCGRKSHQSASAKHCWGAEERRVHTCLWLPAEGQGEEKRGKGLRKELSGEWERAWGLPETKWAQEVSDI